VARDRERGRRAHEREQAQARAQELRREGRGWYYRAVMALLTAVPLAFITWFLPVPLGVVAVACLVQGTRLASRAGAVLGS
jgi:hypothetical protein